LSASRSVDGLTSGGEEERRRLTLTGGEEDGEGEREVDARRFVACLRAVPVRFGGMVELEKVGKRRREGEVEAGRASLFPPSGCDRNLVEEDKAGLAGVGRLSQALKTSGAREADWVEQKEREEKRPKERQQIERCNAAKRVAQLDTNTQKNPQKPLLNADKSNNPQKIHLVPPSSPSSLRTSAGDRQQQEACSAAIAQ
jgi:hypothetical protein